MIYLRYHIRAQRHCSTLYHCKNIFYRNVIPWRGCGELILHYRENSMVVTLYLCIRYQKLAKSVSGTFGLHRVLNIGFIE